MFVCNNLQTYKYLLGDQGAVGDYGLGYVCVDNPCFAEK